MQEPLRKFESRSAIVERIAKEYAASFATPPASPTGSPSRTFSLPDVFGTREPDPSTKHPLPARVKDLMMSDWTREAAIAISLTGTPASSMRSRGSHLLADNLIKGKKARSRPRTVENRAITAEKTASPSPQRRELNGDGESPSRSSTVEEAETPSWRKDDVDVSQLLRSIDKMPKQFKWGVVNNPPY